MNLRRKIFETIIDHHLRWNYVPTRSEIQSLFAGLSDDVDLHLEQLEREGLLRLESGGGEKISIVPSFSQAKNISLRRTRLVGAGSLVEKEAGTIALDLRGIGVSMQSEMYALVVDDDAMEDAGIRSGDIAILTDAPPVRGNVVAVELAGKLVLRRYILPSGIPHLLAENSLRPDLIPALDLPIHGVFWGLIRTGQCHRPFPVASLGIDHLPASLSSGCRAASHPSVGQRIPSDLPLDFRPHPIDALPGKRRRVGQETPLKRTTYVRRQRDWPKPPSGIELNDMSGDKYKSGPDAEAAERMGNSALKQAIEAYEQKEGKPGKGY